MIHNSSIVNTFKLYLYLFERNKTNTFLIMIFYVLHQKCTDVKFAKEQTPFLTILRVRRGLCKPRPAEEYIEPSTMAMPPIKGAFLEKKNILITRKVLIKILRVFMFITNCKNKLSINLYIYI